MSHSAATIDGRPVEVMDGDSILSAARRSGIHIPTLCHHPNLPAEGGCRVCLVEAGGPRPVAACHTPLRAGMVIHTDTPKLRRLRRQVLSLALAALPAERLDGQLEDTELRRLLDHCGIDHEPVGHDGRAAAVDASHPYLRFDAGLCVACRRCLHACETVQGQFVFGIRGRGAGARLTFGAGTDVAGSECVSCGACVAHCPTGAITDRDRLGNGVAEDTVESVCGYCGVGCRIGVATHDGRVTRIDGVPTAAVNRGHLCVKGRYAHGWHGHRLLQPARAGRAIAHLPVAHRRQLHQRAPDRQRGRARLVVAAIARHVDPLRVDYVGRRLHPQRGHGGFSRRPGSRRAWP